MRLANPASPLFLREPESDCEACVVIPARNEEQTIGETLLALSVQVDSAGFPVAHKRYEILLLLNNCSDGTESEVNKFAHRHPSVRLRVSVRDLPSAKANVGYVRRWMMDEACHRLLRIGRASGGILSTDADTNVDSRWVASNLQELAGGADAVGGRILLDEEDLQTLPPDVRRSYLLEVGHGILTAEMEALLDPSPHDPWPRHHQHFCGSLAVRADAYQRVGGLPEVKFLEDVAFFNEITRHDGKFRHSPQVRVTTSGRLEGRASIGLAQHLNNFSETAEACRMVESVPYQETHFRLRRDLRSFWNLQRGGGAADQASSTSLAEKIASESTIPASRLNKELNRDTTFGAAMERIDLPRTLSKQWPEEKRLAPVKRAIPDLRARLSVLRGSAEQCL